MAGLDVIAYLGGWVALTIGLAVVIAKFLAQRIADKLKVKWVAEQEEKLEKIRAEISLEHSTFTTTLNSFSSSHQFSQQNRIEAVNVLWSNISKTRDLSSFAGLFFGSVLICG